MNFSPEKGDFLRLVEGIGHQRVFGFIDSSIEHILQADPSVNTVDAQPAAEIVEARPVTPIQGVVRMNLDEQITAKTEHDNLGDYSRDVIDKLFEEKNAA